MAGLPHVTLLRAAASVKKRHPTDLWPGAAALGHVLSSNPGDANYGKNVTPPDGPPIVIAGERPRRQRRGPLAY